jgi:hypothetical protein
VRPGLVLYDCLEKGGDKQAMTSGQTPPEDIMDSVRLIQRLRSKAYLSSEEKVELNRAKLHVAYWACRSENIIASRDNLAYVLGSDAADIMGSYDKYLISVEEQQRLEQERRQKKAKKGDSEFWEGAS